MEVILILVPAISRLQDTACERSYRSRRKDLWGFIAVEVVALSCIIMHFIARHDSGRHYAVDDYLMFVVLVHGPKPSEICIIC